MSEEDFPPFHEELHKILISKGFTRHRYYILFDSPCDHYMDRYANVIIFFEDETIRALLPSGLKMPDAEFDKFTNGIFDPDK
jgi:hypothetical protein